MIEPRKIEISNEIYLTTGECGILPVEQHKWSNVTQITIPLLLHRNTEYLRYDNNETMDLGYIVFDCAYHKTKCHDNIEVSLNHKHTDSIIENYVRFSSSNFSILHTSDNEFCDELRDISDTEGFGFISRSDSITLIKVISDLMNKLRDELSQSTQLNSLINPTTTTI